MEQEHQPKLKVVRRRRKSVKSRIRARANEQAKLAALEARKVAALEYVGELMEEAISLLKAEGFKLSRPRYDTAQPVAVTPTAQHPCTWCGREGTHRNEDGSGWVCDAHFQYEVGGAVEAKGGQNLFEQMSKKPIVAAPRAPAKPSGPKLVIHPNASETAGKIERPEPHVIDPLKGAIDAAANAGVDSEETGTE